MAELKDLLPYTKELSLLYIDENQEHLTTITTALKKVFSRVDDANDATLGVGYLKVHQYDIVVVDATSLIMNTKKLIENIQINNNFTEIILTSRALESEALSDTFTLGVSSILIKPFKNTTLLEYIKVISLKLQHNRHFCEDELKNLNDDLIYERKRIGRFMMNEKNLNTQIQNYKDSVNINRNIYDLTKLPSRFALQDAFSEQVQAILYINIDHFEFVNTTYGMGKANKLLKECAITLGLYLPKNAQLFHITADEFVILIDDPVENQSKMLSSQIQALFLESSIAFDKHEHSIVFSIGIDEGIGKQLFINSKAASKEARYFGGNQIVVYNPHSKYMKDQRESLYWVEVLKKAFDEDKIFTYYQPIISNDNSSLKHYEVLCRLMDENGKLVDASKFINSAKQVGLITKITRMVIDKTFKLFTENDYNFSINISMHDLHEEYLLKFLTYKCERYSIAPQRVHLEIVEDILISKSDVLDEQVRELKKHGFHVILDDFGTDKSAYSRMFELEAEYIKIDGTFIKELTKDSAHRIIVKSIVDFAKKSGIKTIAEHVESEEIYKIVKELGIDYFQGYYLGKPSINL